MFASFNWLLNSNLLGTVDFDRLTRITKQLYIFHRYLCSVIDIVLDFQRLGWRVI